MQISEKIAYYLPKNTSEEQLRSLTGDDFYTFCSTDHNCFGKTIAKTAYFWPLVLKPALLKPHPGVKVSRNRFLIENLFNIDYNQFD